MIETKAGFIFGIQTISSAYVKVEHLTSDQAKIEFLNLIAKKETFGSAFFPVGFISSIVHNFMI